MVDWLTLGFMALTSLLVLFVLSKFFRAVGSMAKYISETFGMVLKLFRPVTKPVKRFVRRYKYRIKKKLRR